MTKTCSACWATEAIAPSTTTDGDVRNQVRQAADGAAATYAVYELTGAIIDRYGLVDINDIDPREFWAMVQSFEIRVAR